MYHKKLNVILADATNLPYNSNMFDVTLSIAVLHHLLSRKDVFKLLMKYLE
jgi:ubiquinone/menaquinone biosynthesis C-methylase UbiE